jgi:uncharacterized metal-binding protein (TIGR02443 family)
VTRRRFIAGAVCPKCGALDRIVLEDGDRRRRCIACGFTDTLLPSAPPTAPRGKLDMPHRAASKTGSDEPKTIVRLVTPSRDKPTTPGAPDSDS